MPSTNLGPSSSTQSNTVATYTVPLSVTTPRRLVSYGDSITTTGGVGSNTPGQMYASKLQALFASQASYLGTAVAAVTHPKYLNATLVNAGLGAGDVCFGLPMFNTMRLLTPDPNVIQEVAADIEGFLGWMAVPDSKKIRAIIPGTTTPNPQLAQTGTWTYFGLDGVTLTNLALRSATAGSTLTFPTVTGDTVYVWYARGTLTDTSSAVLFIDGDQYQIEQNAPHSTWLATQGNWVIACQRITGLTNGSHTVRFSIPTGGQVNVIAVAGFDSSTIAAEAPAVITGNCLRMIPNVGGAGYAFAGNTGNDPLSNTGGITLSAGTVTAAPYFYGHAGVDFWNRLIRQSVTNLSGDGLRVTLLDVAAQYLTHASQMVDADTVHPNVGGMQMLFNNFARAMKPLFRV